MSASEPCELRLISHAPLGLQDIEATRGIRRYVGLLFSVPHSRRSKQSRAEAARTEQDKIVTGFFLHELDVRVALHCRTEDAR